MNTLEKCRKLCAHIRGWRCWEQLLYPHPLIVATLALISAVGLPWVFLTGRDFTIGAYILYGLSAYALTTVVAGLVRLVPWARRKTEPIRRKLRSAENGAFGLDLYAEQIVNFVYGGWKSLHGILVGSAWIGADGIYNFVQSLIQLYQILRHKKTSTIRQKWQIYRQCGFMMLILHLTVIGPVFQMIHMGRHEASTEIAIISTAVYTFYKLVKAVVEVAKDRKHENPVDSAVYFLDFSQALYNLFVLQVGLLWVYGGKDFPYQKLMNTLTGGVVCLMVCGMGMYMVCRANRDMKKAPLE